MANRSDDFNRSNTSSALGTPSGGGADWVELASHWGIRSFHAYAAGGGDPAVSYLECGSADVTVQATNVNVSGQGGIAVRIVDADNLWLVQFVSTSYYALYRRESGSYNLVDGPSANVPVAGDVVSVVLSGTSIIVKVNGTTRLTATSSFNQTATKHGLYAGGDTSLDVDDFSISTGVPDTLLQNDPSVVSTTDTTINLLAPVATGGTPTYAYQWKRATAANGSYSNVGTNSVTLADSTSLSAGVTYWYTITATDSAGSPQTDTSYPVPAKLSGKAFKVRVIGDSHWAGDSPAGGQNAPAEFVTRLGAILKPRLVSLGGNSSISGSHSADFIPGASGTPLETAVTAANSSGDNLFIIELASNDATNGGSPPVSAATYGANIALIVNYIKANATGTPLTIALLHPFYYYDRNGTLAGLNELFAYAAQLESLADGVTVFTAGLMTRYQIVTAQSTYLYTDKLHLSNTAGQNLSADNAAADLAGKLQFASAGGGGLMAPGGGGMTGGFNRS